MSRQSFPNSNTRELARLMRISAIKMVHRARASHIASALSICDIVAVLYGRALRIDVNDSLMPSRDRFLLSKGHACVAVYAALAEVGILKAQDLLTYGQSGSVLMNHISHKVRGVEFSTGSLGHGLPFGVGKALVAKHQFADWRTLILLGDGELGEGSNWEAAMFAAHHKLDNLIAIVDYNKLQSLTTVDETLRIEPLAQKFQAFGWCVQEIDGHNHEEIYSSLNSAPWVKEKPSLIIANTIKGKGVSYMENTIEWHYRSPNDEQLAIALEELEG